MGVKENNDWMEEQIKKFKVGHLSPSSLNMYMRCGIQFLFRYVLKSVQVPPVGVILLGTSSHETFKRYYTHKKEKQEDLPLSTVTDFFVQNIQNSFKNGWAEDESTNFLENAGVKVVTEFREKRGMVTIPVEVEQKETNTFKFLDTDISITTVIDLITETNIIDHKITSRKKYEGNIANDIQLGTYTLVKGKEGMRVGWDYYYRPKKSVNSTVESVDIQCSQINTNRVLYLYYKALDSIKKGVFPAARPEEWACSPKYCGYWDFCQGFHTIKETK